MRSHKAWNLVRRACVAPGWGLSVIDEFVSLVNPVLFEPPFPPAGAALPEGAAGSFRALDF